VNAYIRPAFLRRLAWAIAVLLLALPPVGTGAQDGAKSAPPTTAAPAVATPAAAPAAAPVDELAAVLDRETRQYLDYARAQERKEADALRTIQAELLESVAKMESVRAGLDARLKKEDAFREGKIAELVKIYETMQPEEIARVVARLDGDLRYQVLARLKKKTLSRILAEMPADQAAQTSQRLLETRTPENGAGMKPN
jgi:flagellar motility protein MotE (MotC chaperone)